MPSVRRQRDDSMSSDWLNTLHRQIQDLTLIASWASQTNLGRVRDHIRHAIYELQSEIERVQLMMTDSKEKE